MRELKWKYDKKFKQWWVGESKPYDSDGATIEKTEGREFYLKMDYPQCHFRFKKLANAKLVAQLLTHG